jgi:prepilin-type N-terminal cleavage/methylation domain-containing protein
MLSTLELRSEDGFSLIELLAAMLLLGVLVGAFAGIFTMVQQRDNTLQGQSVLATQARPMVDAMATELESAMCNGTTQPVTTAKGTQLSFTAPDRQQPYHLQQISYTLSNGVLTRQVAISTNTGGPPWTMGPAVTTGTVPSVTNAVAFDFRKQPPSGDALGQNDPTLDLSPNGAAVSAANLSLIREVTVLLTVAPSSASNGTAALTTQASATLRTPTCN